MNWELIEFSTFSGKYNMEFDLELVRKLKSDLPILRFYGWEPWCISLGANQSYSEINLIEVKNNNLDIVKRPTGGRAILHAEELTYSVIMPNNNNVSGKLLYEKISNAIVGGLKLFDYALRDVELENIQPNFPNLLEQPSGSLCFASSAKSEIKFHGKKLVGSAQRKLGSTILQHGSILIGKEHTKLADFLNVNAAEREMLKTEICEKTTEINSITGYNTDIILLQKMIIKGFEEIFEANFNVYQTESIIP